MVITAVHHPKKPSRRETDLHSPSRRDPQQRARRSQRSAVARCYSFCRERLLQHLPNGWKYRRGRVETVGLEQVDETRSSCRDWRVSPHMSGGRGFESKVGMLSHMTGGGLSSMQLMKIFRERTFEALTPPRYTELEERERERERYLDHGNPPSSEASHTSQVQ